MAIKKYLCVTDGGGLDSADDGVLLPLDKFAGLDLSEATGAVGSRIIINFIEVADEHATKTSRIGVIHEFGKNRACMEQITTAFCSNPKDGFLILDNDAKDFLPGSYSNVITSVSTQMEN